MPREPEPPAQVALKTVSLDSALAAAVADVRTWFGSSVPTLDSLWKQMDAAIGASQGTIPRTAQQKITLITSILYERWDISFDPNQDDLLSLLPQTVVERKQGSCLGVSLLYLLIAQRLQVPLFGVVLPGHFFVRYDDTTTRINCEPNRKGFPYTDERYRTKYGAPEGSWYDLRNLSIPEVVGVFRYNLGNICLKQGKYDAAIKCYQLSIAALPGFAECYGNMGICYDGLEKTQQAIAAMEKARSLRPGLANLSRNLGTLYCKNALYSKAIEIFVSGLQAAPNDPDLLYGMGLAWYSSGDKQKAREYLQAALKAKPDLPQAALLLSKIEGQ